MLWGRVCDQRPLKLLWKTIGWKVSSEDSTENGGKPPWDGGPLVITIWGNTHIHLIYWVLGMSSPFQGLVQGVNSYVPSQGYHHFPYDRDFWEVRSPDFQKWTSMRGMVYVPTNASPMDPMGEEVWVKWIPTMKGIPLWPVGKGCSGCVQKVCWNNLRFMERNNHRNPIMFQVPGLELKFDLKPCRHHLWENSRGFKPSGVPGRVQFLSKAPFFGTGIFTNKLILEFFSAKCR